MSDFTPPPRGKGKHWRGREREAEPVAYRQGRASGDPNFLPPLEEPDPEADLPDGLYRVPTTPSDRTGYGPAISQTRMNRPPRMAVAQDERPADLVVPRVYVEPDEYMDRLRARALRWAIFRDLVVIVVGLFLISRWMVVPMVHALGF
jgi:hypothetical protein